MKEIKAIQDKIAWNKDMQLMCLETDEFELNKNQQRIQETAGT